MSLIKAHRTHGHLAARLDPLGSEPEGDPALDPEPLGLTPEIMAQIPASILRVGVPGETLADVIPHLRETYCGTIAYEIEHIASHRQRVWLREKIETGAFRKPLTAEEKQALLRRLTQVDSLERFMHKAYLGQKQFSIEGLDMTVPMLDEMIQLAAAEGAREVVIGMAHRGRLNVLAHNLGPRVRDDLPRVRGRVLDRGRDHDPAGRHRRRQVPPRRPGHLPAAATATACSCGWSPTRATSSTSARSSRAPRARSRPRRQGPHAHLDTNAAMPIILHGDAAFPGQGVVAETFNLQALDGYTVGGTLHLIQNNQVGFTTDPDDSRSTRWASDLAKGFDVPIIHVNADDVAACISAVRLAFAFRQEFGHDVADRPDRLPPLRPQRGRRAGLHAAGDGGQDQGQEAGARALRRRSSSSEGAITQEEADAIAPGDLGRPRRAPPRAQGGARRARATSSRPAATSSTARPRPRSRPRSPPSACRRSTRSCCACPRASPSTRSWSSSSSAGATPIGPDGGIDWAQAEALAYASLLTEGTPVRLTGQDVERGTFSQRHLVLHDAKTGQRDLADPERCPGALAPMELHNSPLSEIACLGFEYGYSMEAPETLVLWEAQFGDFVNSAQVIIDQFIVSALAKWGQTHAPDAAAAARLRGLGPGALLRRGSSAS